MLISAILYVLFGQITVRKLRKNIDTKDALGIEFASGWDIINVAQALTIPGWLSKRLMQSSLSAFAADASIIKAHTNRFDRFLARLFYGLFLVSGLFGILLVLLDTLGIFD
ncbi:MAG: hypothetical protein GY820_21055 [Gammaproteobacteria bacterium]|nr:hypothetical protein [Gammaproteobacteria bacterium]